MKNKDDDSSISIAAVGDMAFIGEELKLPALDVFGELKSSFEACDLIIGNLESPLIYEGTGTPGKCTLQGDPGWAEVMKTAGFGYVSLANNHMMDFNTNGLKSTIRHLETAGIRYSGAGKTVSEACHPAILEIKGKKIAIFSFSSVVVSSRCYAEQDKFGVAPFELQRTLDLLNKIRHQVDFIIICLHWGIEHYAYPTADQRKFASALVKGGADCIIGHHPHTLQGMERIEGGIIVYSLGNFVFNDFKWQMLLEDGTQRQSEMVLSDENRKGMVFRFELSGASVNVGEHIFTWISKGGKVKRCTDHRAANYYKKISSKLNVPFYGLIWKLHSFHMEWRLRFSQSISITKIMKDFRKIRPHHIKQAFSLLLKSFRIVTGKSTNPYE